MSTQRAMLSRVDSDYGERKSGWIVTLEMQPLVTAIDFHAAVRE